MKTLLTLLCLVILLALGPGVASAEIARPAPDFFFQGPKGRASNLKSLRGQPVILVAATSARSGDFRKQVKYLEELYRRFAGLDAVFFAAFAEGDGQPKTDIPFVVVSNGAKTFADYTGSNGKFAVAVIGIDGNLDLLTSKVVSANYVQMVIDNAYPAMAAQRKQ